MYIGACQECNARVTGATMEKNALGYSGSNSGGKLVIENSIFRNNSAGVVPNSENPGDAPPPQDGECGRPNNPPVPPNPTPENITTTNIQRCTVIRNNLITEKNNLTVPVDESTARVGYGVGVLLPGDYADPIASGANEIFQGKPSESTNNCLSSNSFSDATFPKSIQSGWSCNHNTTLAPGGAPGIYEFIAAVPEEAAKLRKEMGQPPPPPQPTMPNPCEGVPKNPL
jgi:hypothetical protein